MRWTGHAAWTKRGMHMRFWWESRKKIDQQEDLDVSGRILLKLILEK
jgi:hypothetical protein